MEKQIVVFYSFSGRVKKLAEDYAKEKGAELYEVVDATKHNKMWAVAKGAPSAIKRKMADVAPITCDFSAYDIITVFMPIWAGCPAPAFNNVVTLLPEGKKVELMFMSATTGSLKSKPKTIELVEQKKCTVIEYKDILRKNMQ